MQYSLSLSMSRRSESATAKPSSPVEGNKDDDEESQRFLARLDKLGDFIDASISLPYLCRIARVYMCAYMDLTHRKKHQCTCVCVHPSNRFAFLARISFYRRTSMERPQSSFNRKHDLRCKNSFLTLFSRPTSFGLFPLT